MPIFYAPDIKTSTTLPEEESLHASRVLRLKEGDKISIVDGIGGFFKAEIVLTHHKRSQVKILEALEDSSKRDYYLHMAVAPTKNIDRFEWFIEKATEIGVDEISPILCRYSERKIIKHERLQKIIVSASKQSKKARFPILNPLLPFNEFLEKNQASQKFIAHCYQGEKGLLKNLYRKSSDSLVLIGPEGDFSEEEVEKALASGFQAISLGESRLRTETAAVVACATVNFVNL